MNVTKEGIQQLLCRSTAKLPPPAAMPRPHLLLHLLDFFDGASPNVFLFKLDVGSRVGGARRLLVLLLHRLPNLLFLLLLRLFQFALGADAVSVVHVVGFHHLHNTTQSQRAPRSDFLLYFYHFLANALPKTARCFNITISQQLPIMFISNARPKLSKGAW